MEQRINEEEQVLRMYHLTGDFMLSRRKCYILPLFSPHAFSTPSRLSAGILPIFRRKVNEVKTTTSSGSTIALTANTD
jgi:hypothetical protein